MADPARRIATYADVLAAPDTVVAELIDGVLETHPHPTPRHGRATSRLNTRLSSPFDFGEGGPGGWIFMVEPETHLGSAVVVPDLAGWRRETLPAIPDEPYLTVRPDWVCEVLSPSTERLDRGRKREIYAASSVGHLWLLDPRSRFLEAFALTAGHWLLVGTVESGGEVRLPPFDAVGFALDDLFPFDAPTPSTEA